jgi:hypothetical protein
METIIDKDFFEVTWGDGYPVTPKRGIALEDLISSEKWELDSKFISRLEQTEIGDRLRYTDPSGEVFFERITFEYAQKESNGYDLLESILLRCGFNLEYTGGGCTCFTSQLDTDHWIMVTDGDAGTDFEGQVWIGLYRGNPFENQEIMHMTAELDLAIADGIDDTIRLLSYFQPKLCEFLPENVCIKENS